MAKVGTLALSGDSGTEYSFNLYDYGTEFKEVPAVYVVTKKYRNNAGKMVHKVLYAGQTDNMEERHHNHHKSGCFDKNGATHTGVNRDGSEQSRLDKEADLIESYDPPCNG